MSGGHFDYQQYRITNMYESIQNVIENNKRILSEKELRNNFSWREDPEHYIKYPEDRMEYNYSDDVIEEFKKGIEYLKKAQVYAQRIDWLLSGDDREDSFIMRLEEDLNKI